MSWKFDLLSPNFKQDSNSFCKKERGFHTGGLLERWSVTFDSIIFGKQLQDLRNVHTIIHSCLQCFLKTNKLKNLLSFWLLPDVTQSFKTVLKLSQQYLNLLSVLLNVKTVISSLRFKSAASPDLINNYILSILPNVSLQNLTKISNQFLREGSFSPKWHEYDIILIPKSEKKRLSHFSCILYF